MAKREELFDDPKTVLVRAPYVVGKIDAVRMIGEQLAATFLQSMIGAMSLLQEDW
jgi:hypothetical protein